MNRSARLPVAVTMGEPAGVGGELVLKAWCGHAGLPPFFAVDDPGRLEALARRLSLDVPIRVVDEPEEAGAAFAAALPVLTQRLSRPVAPGRPDPANTGAVVASVRRAVELARASRAAAVVTSPIHKATLYEGGFGYSGHTEYLGALAGHETRPVMMLTCPGLRVVPVTGHRPLKQAVAALTREGIVHHGRVTAAALIGDFAIARPRLAVAALNPHAGEGGALGGEEGTIIGPAVDDLRRLGIDARGPIPADTLFHAEARRGYDAALCMYHDQALIPLKTLDFAHGVNVTLGLPFVRTSPDHGTALDIAGTGRADPASFIAALEMAARIAVRREAAARAHRVA